MTDAILIFTFSPVQPFIAESRRAEDLYAGSKILVHLATAAAIAIGKEYLIYPDQEDLGCDVPNRLVARVPQDQAAELARQAEQALFKQWQDYVTTARDSKLAYLQPGPDATWLNIWQRQTINYWECYWAFAPCKGSYGDAYDQASRTLDAAKRTRCFNQSAEPGMKDTLSGQRSALRLQQMDAKEYWAAIADNQGVTPSKLRPEGKERLDAIGAVKRFGLPEKEYQMFLSVSSIAAADFLEKAEEHPEVLTKYRQVVEQLKLHQVPSDEKDWPYDGDLFFLETLTPNRLADSYHLKNPDDQKLDKAKDTLQDLHKAVGWSPTPYYALLLLDGDGMGEKASNAAREGEEQHRAFSKSLSSFAVEAKEVVKGNLGQSIYIGGDDVFSLAPISTVFNIGRVLQDKFYQKTGGTVSAGIVLAHHLYPLHAALQAVRETEQTAKKIKDKATIVIRVLKRNGETLEVCSKWQDIPKQWDTLVDYFQQQNGSGPLSSRLAHNLAAEARIVTALKDKDAHQAVLHRLIKRHQAKKLTDEQIETIDKIEAELIQSAAALDSYIPSKTVNGEEIKSGFAEMSRWLLLAHFVARRGGD